jgi:hypothetical protein
VEEEHKLIVTKLDKIEQLIQELEEGGTVDTLLTAWIDYEDQKKPQLLYEEEHGVPLMRAYFTPEEIVKPAADKLGLGAVFYWNGEDFIRNEFMPQNGIPFYVWYVDFQFKRNAYQEEFIKNVDAVKEGVEPPAPLTWWQSFVGMFS